MSIFFGDFELDSRLYQLRRRGKLIPIERRVFDLIHFLALNRDRVVSKEELFVELWNGRAVSKASLSVAVAAARRALGDTPQRQGAIRTSHGRGYQFVARMQDPRAASGLAPLDTIGSPHPFVGRDNELSVLLTASDLVVHGRAQCALISGEPGIGKTRLSEEFSQLAATRGLEVLTGRCHEGEGAPALWPWVQILRRLAFDRNRPQFAATLPPELSELLPELREFSDIRNQAAIRDVDLARFRLFDAIGQILVRRSRLVPLLLILDDLHNADQPSLELVDFVARGSRNARLFLVLSYRDSELQRKSSRAQSIGRIARDLETHQILLAGLSPAETRRFVEVSTGQSPTDRTVEVLHSKTAGNPFFLTQLLPVLARSGDVAVDSGLPALPPGIREAILRQLDGLPESSRQLLALASVIGRQFSMTALELITSTTSIDVLRLLQPALDSRLLLETSPVGSFRFSHVLVRDALYEQLSAVTRADLHGRVGRALEHTCAASLDEHAGEIAKHFLAAASDAERAFAYSERAAQAATRRFAYDEAADHYRSALGLLRSSEPGAALKRCSLLLGLGAQQCRAGDRLGAKETFERAARLAGEIGAPEQLADAALGLAPGFFAIEGGVVDEFLIRLLEQALEALGDQSRALRARLLARLALALLWAESAQGRRQALVGEALEIAERLGDPDTSLYVLHTTWLARWTSRGFDSRQKDSIDLLARARERGDPETLLVCQLFHLLTLLERGETASFDAEAAEFASLADELRQPQSIWYSRLLRATRAFLGGRFDDAAKLADEFSAMGAEIGDANAFHSLMSHLLLQQWERGRIHEFADLAREGVRRFPAMRAWRAALAWTLVQANRVEEARLQFEILAEREFDDLPERFDWGVTVALLSETCCELGDDRRAQKLYEILLPIHDRHLVIGLCVLSWGSVSRHLGRLAATMSCWEAAFRHFHKAMAENERSGAKPWLAHTMVDYAQALLASGTRDTPSEARQLLRNAVELAEGLGMTNLVSRVEKVAADFHHPIP